MSHTFEPGDRVRVHAPDTIFHGLTGTVEVDDPDFPVADTGRDVYVALDAGQHKVLTSAAYEFDFDELRGIR